jgi:Zn finger protein HypA/HybF involved in hydrogenase expression
VDLVAFEASKHASMGCTGCHSSITKLPHVGKPAPVACANCHEDQVKAYSKSVHGTALNKGIADAAICRSCHGSEHQILGSDNPASRTYNKNLADTCATCHSDPKFWFLSISGG